MNRPLAATFQSLAHIVQHTSLEPQEAIVKSDERNRYLTRDTVLKLLSDDEIARVSTAESAPRLGDGDEYLDLDALDQGVRRAPRADTLMGRVLPRKAVQEETWSKILRELAGADIASPPSGGQVNDW